ncbi:MAG: hypothetical protein U1A16_01700 [Patescibacteria group bacterium]|nr:hypothetical protein [Patescibacteria group bacterium]
MADSDNTDLKALLEENLALTKEMHRAVVATRRYILWGRILDTLKFLLVIGALAGTYFFVQPYLNRLLETYQQIF